MNGTKLNWNSLQCLCRNRLRLDLWFENRLSFKAGRLNRPGRDKRSQRFHTAACRPRLLLEYAFGPLAHRRGRRTVLQQLDQDPGQVLLLGNADGFLRNEVFGDGAEVGEMGAHDNGDAELRRLQGVVATVWKQAAAHKRCRCKLIDGRQFADAVQQHNLAGLKQFD